MIAGRMKYTLRMFRPDAVRNQFGEMSITYTDVGTARAERIKLSSRRSEEVAEHFPDYHVSYNVRNAHPVRENWRVEQLGGYLYTVVAVEPNLDKGFNTLICERVNE